MPRFYIHVVVWIKEYMSCRRLTAATTIKYELETLKLILRIKTLKITKKDPVLHFLSFFLLFLSVLCKSVCQTFCFSTQSTVEYNSAKCRQVILSHTSLTHEDVSAIHRRLCRINDIRHSIYERDQSFVFKVKTVINSSFFTNSRSFFERIPVKYFTNSRLFFLQTPVYFFTNSR